MQQINIKSIRKNVISHSKLLEMASLKFSISQHFRLNSITNLSAMFANFLAWLMLNLEVCSYDKKCSPRKIFHG
uniref:Putative ovule protein n=1 Tax=Solanum chacoense TaxID=4108 RepID=A0A0V0IN77_SOLCH